MKNKRVKIKEFWVINTSKKNVMLSDLYLTIPAGKYYNLLDKKHFYYTEQQLDESLKSGSLYKKQKMIKKCEDKPQFDQFYHPQLQLSKQPMITRKRSAVKVKYEDYDELIVSDEKYANEIADLFAEDFNDDFEED